MNLQSQWNRQQIHAPGKTDLTNMTAVFPAPKGVGWLETLDKKTRVPQNVGTLGTLLPVVVQCLAHSRCAV